MNEIITDIVSEIITEFEDSSSNIGVYAGGFKPPTLGHFNVVLESLKRYPNIDKFIIYVGKKERNGITQDQSLLIWDIYKKYLPIKVEIIPSNIPITSVYDLAKQNPKSNILWFIGAREGKDEDFKDFASRTRASVHYPNIQPIQIVMKSDISGTQFREALKNRNIDIVKKLLPSKLTIDEINYIIDLLSNSINEVIKKENNKWNVFSKSGKKLGSHLSKSKAEKQLQAIHINQNISEKIDLKNIVEQLKSSLKKILEVIKTEGVETKQAFNIIKNSIKNDKKLTKEEISFCYNQLKDVFKTVGLGGILMLPGSFVILALIKVLKAQKYFYPNSLIAEELSKNEGLECEQYVNDLYNHYKELYPNIDIWPKVNYINDDIENSKDFFGKTAYYNPQNFEITLFTCNRHPKDITRSFSHEMFHHIQNQEGRLNNYSTTNVNEDDHLEEIEKEAYEQGNIIFRKWENNKK